MELPVISQPRTASPESLVRAIKHARADLLSSFIEPIDTDVATAFVCRERPTVSFANAAYEARLSPGIDANLAIETMISPYRDAEIHLRQCVPNDLILDPALEAELVNAGLKPVTRSLLVMENAPALNVDCDDLQIISARAAVAQYRELRFDVARTVESDDSAAGSVADCYVDMLDESKIDVLIARLNRQTVAAGAVYSAGEVGILRDLATHPDHENEDIMASLMIKLLELCARSQFKTIIAEGNELDVGAQRVYLSAGMAPLLDFNVYEREG